MKTLVLEAWNNRELLKENKYVDIIKEVIEEVDKGRLRTASPTADGWEVNEWVFRHSADADIYASSL
jgi:2,3,4,5-tetrahydropyridine-2-carboxylate N-succinyltransferase